MELSPAPRHRLDGWTVVTVLVALAIAVLGAIGGNALRLVVVAALTRGGIDAAIGLVVLLLCGYAVVRVWRRERSLA